MNSRRKRIKTEAAAVRAILNAWDPITGGFSPADEYDCLVDHIVSVLHRGATEEERSKLITSEFADHFGAPVADPDVSRVAKEIWTWWGRERNVP